jgi:hypothetical protein
MYANHFRRVGWIIDIIHIKHIRTDAGQWFSRYGLGEWLPTANAEARQPESNSWYLHRVVEPDVPVVEPRYKDLRAATVAGALAALGIKI